MTTLYSDDFQARTPGDASNTFGWSSADITVLDDGGSYRLGRNGGTFTYDTQRTFTTGGVFSYDWNADTSNEKVLVKVNGVTQNTHDGPGSGSSSVTVPDSGTLLLSFQAGADHSWVDNLSLDSADISIDGKNIRTPSRVSKPDVLHRSLLATDDIRTESRVSKPDVIATDLITVDDVRTSHRVAQGVLLLRHPLTVDDIRTSHRVSEPYVLANPANGENIRTMHRVRKVSIAVTTWQPKGRPRPRLFFRGGALLG